MLSRLVHAVNNKGHRKKKRLREGRVTKVILVSLAILRKDRGTSSWLFLVALVVKGLI